MKFTEELIAHNFHFIYNTFFLPKPDNVPYVAVKAGDSLIVRQLRRLFQFSFDNSFVPVHWITAYITPIFKKRNCKNPGNY